MNDHPIITPPPISKNGPTRTVIRIAHRPTAGPSIRGEAEGWSSLPSKPSSNRFSTLIWRSLNGVVAKRSQKRAFCSTAPRVAREMMKRYDRPRLADQRRVVAFRPGDTPWLGQPPAATDLPTSSGTSMGTNLSAE